MATRYKKYLIDTNIFSLFYLGHSSVVKNWRLVHDDDKRLSIITVGEVVWGRVNQANKNQKDEVRVLAQYGKLYEHFTEELCSYQICDYRPSAPEIFRQFPSTVKCSDRRIAAIALDYNCVLVTNDTADFPRLNRSDLVVEDWTIDPDL